MTLGLAGPLPPSTGGYAGLSLLLVSPGRGQLLQGRQSVISLSYGRTTLAALVYVGWATVSVLNPAVAPRPFVLRLGMWSGESH